jgi:hypothetical protein
MSSLGSDWMGPASRPTGPRRLQTDHIPPEGSNPPIVIRGGNQRPAHEAYFENLQRQDLAIRNSDPQVRRRTNAGAGDEFENISLNSPRTRHQISHDDGYAIGMIDADRRAIGWPHNKFKKNFMTKDAINQRIKEMIFSKPVKIGGAVIGGGAALVGAGAIGAEMARNKRSDAEVPKPTTTVETPQQTVMTTHSSMPAPTTHVLPPPITIDRRVTPTKRRHDDDDSQWNPAVSVLTDDEIARNNVIDDYWMRLKHAPNSIGNRFSSSYDDF